MLATEIFHYRPYFAFLHEIQNHIKNSHLIYFQEFRYQEQKSDLQYIQKFEDERLNTSSTMYF